MRWIRRLTRENCVRWIGQGKGIPPMMMAFRDDGISAIVIPRDFDNYEAKRKAWTEAATIIPAIGAQRAVLQTDTYVRIPVPGEPREEYEAAVLAHEAGRSLADDPKATDAVNVTAYDGPSDRLDSLLMPYSIREREGRRVIVWAQEHEWGMDHDVAAGWVPDLIKAMVKASLEGWMHPTIQAFWPAVLKELGHKVILEGERFGQN